MGRSARAAGDLAGTAPEEAGGQLWEQVRRALGRLVTHTAVRAVLPQQIGPAATVRRPAALPSMPPDSGRREEDWPPRVRDRGAALPTAGAGGGGSDLASLTPRVSADIALGPQGHRLVSLSLRAQAPVSHTLPPDDWRLSSPGVHAAPARPGGGSVRALEVALSPRPATARLASAALTLSPRPPAGDGRGLLRPAGGRVRPGASALARVPLRRARQASPPGVAMQDAFAREWRHLAAAAKTPAEDVLLLGVYPQVPVGAVSRLSVEPDGSALLLWLKPEAAARAAPLRAMTLVIGRQRSTGKMIQTVV